MEGATPGLMLVLSAPSGTGKTTLARRLLQEEPDAAFSVSATTRPPRGAERDGRDYRFVDEAAFDRMIAAGELLEWAHVHGHRYGTPRQSAAEAAAGKLVLLDIDVQGGLQVKRQLPAAVTVFLLPPSLEELERRLRLRRTEAEEVVRRRLEAARAEVAAGRAAYDYVVLNEDLERAAGDLRAIARFHRGTATPLQAARERELRARG
jgi:guanylate kinase